MWIATETWQKMGTFPTSILEDPNVSVGAKGLYMLLYHANPKICGLADLSSNFTTTPKAELENLWQELIDKGYVDVTKNKNGEIKNVKLVRVAKKSKTKVQTPEEQTAIQEQVNVVKEQKVENRYTRLVDRIEGWEIPKNVKTILITYFTAWLNGEGRFASADMLRPSTVDRLIGELVAMHLDKDSMIWVVQQSIDHCWFKFVAPTEPITKRTIHQGFSATGIVSGTYTDAEKEEIRKKREELEHGKKGETVF